MRLKRGGWPYANPPNVPFTLNTMSPQARGLVAWWPPLATFGALHLKTMVRDSGDYFDCNTTSPDWIFHPRLGAAVSDGNTPGGFSRSAPLGRGVPYTEFTWLGWIKNVEWWGRPYTNKSSDGVVVIQTEDGGSGHRVRFFAHTGSWSSTISANMVLNGIYHIACRWDGSWIQVFLNGRASGTPTSVSGTLTSSWNEGVHVNSDENSTGSAIPVGDSRVYERALSDAEILQQYKNPWELYRPSIAHAARVTPLTWIDQPSWVSPPDAGSMAPAPTLVFTMPSPSSGNMHFHLQMDTANTFDTGNLRDYQTLASQTGWEYWDGDSWEPFPAGGVANTYCGNNARYTIQTGDELTETTWYRRIRGHLTS